MTWRSGRVLPRFVVIGAMKAGTTTLWGLLSGHPQIFLTTPKEMNFFVAERNWSKGRSWYEAQFAEAEPGVVCGDISPNYAKDPVFRGVPERMVSVLPDVRLVYVVRDPLARIDSHLRHHRSATGDPRPADVLVRNEPSFLATSSYGHQLEQYARSIPLDRIHVVSFADLRDAAIDLVRDICRFVGVDDRYSPEIGAPLHPAADLPVIRPSLWRVPAVRRRWVNKQGFQRRRGSRVLTAQRPDDALRGDLREWVISRLEPDMARFAALTGMQVPGWPPRDAT